MQSQPNDEHNYLTIASLELRINGLCKLLEAFTLHCLDYPALYSKADAQKWIEEGRRLIEKAEKLQKEERT